MYAKDDVRVSPPARFGLYEVQRLLGRGAMASVYECRHTRLGRLVAVKAMHPHLARDEIAAARFLREGRALSRIAHPNVVEVFDIGESDGVPYLVMSLVVGDHLGEHLRRHHPMHIADVVDCLLPAVSAVAAAHAVGVIHRDLKPSNIQLTRDRYGKLTPMVLDFGISKLTADGWGPDLTDTEGTLGTASYMSPEQLRSAKQVDARSDVYALGVILYQCATGKRPFERDNVYDLMHAIMTEPVVPPSAVRHDLPSQLDAIVLRAIQRDPAERVPSALELGRSLAPLASDPAAWTKEFADVRDVPSDRPRVADSEIDERSFTLISASERPRRRYVSPLAIAIASAVVCVAIAGALGGASHRSRPSPAPAAVSSGSYLRTTAGPTPPVEVNDTMSPARSAFEEHAAPLASSALARQTAKVGAAPVRPAPVVSVHAARPEVTEGLVHSTEEIGTNGAPIVE